MSPVSNVSDLFPASHTLSPARTAKPSESFQRLLIAAADQARRRRGLSAPAPSRTPSLRVPPPLRFTPVTPYDAASAREKFKPLPLSRAKSNPTSNPPDSTPTGTKPAQTTSQQAGPADSLARQVLSDYQEYMQMMQAKSGGGSQTDTSGASRQIPTRRAPSQSTFSAVHDRSTEGKNTAVPRSDSEKNIQLAQPEGTPRTPFPRNGEVSIHDQQSAPQVTSSTSNPVQSPFSRGGSVVPGSRADQGSNGSLSSGVQGSTPPPARSVGPDGPGLLSRVSDFAGDLASGLTLGLYRPSDEPAPEGLSRLFYPFKKIVVDAVLKDLVIGVPGSLLRRRGGRSAVATLESGRRGRNPDAPPETAATARSSRRRVLDLPLGANIYPPANHRYNAGRAAREPQRVTGPIGISTGRENPSTGRPRPPFPLSKNRGSLAQSVPWVPKRAEATDPPPRRRPRLWEGL